MLKRLPALMILASLVGGCGTIMTIGQNKLYPVQVYSGTQMDFGGGWAFAHALPDVPFTIAADSIALPYTAPATVVNLITPPNRRKNAGILGDGADASTAQSTTHAATLPGR